MSDPEGLRASDSAPAGVKPDPTTFEPVTEEVTPNARKREVEKDFGRWFAIYPRKAEQRAAFRLFERVLQKREATVEELVAGAQRYAIEVHGRDPAMVKHPTTWLQRQCWVQDPQAAVPAPAHGPPERAFDLPPKIVSSLLAAAPDVSACIYGATWREEDQTIITVSRWGADTLRQRVGPVRLRSIGVNVEPASK